MKIPSIDELAEMYPYSRMTIFKAVEYLVSEGYLESRRGVGTFVLRDRIAGIVGLVIGEEVLHPQRTPLASILAQEVRRFFERIGYRFKLYIDHNYRIEDAEVPTELREDLAAKRLTGLMTAACNTPLALPECPIWQENPIPHVDMTSHRLPVPQVVMDTDAMMEIFLLYARQRGVQRVGMIMGDERAVDYWYERCLRHGLETRPAWICFRDSYAQHYERNGYELMNELWQADEKPQAVLVKDDIACKGVVQACLQVGIEIPGDLHLVTAANRNSGVFYPVELPVIEFDIAEIARRLGDLLLDAIQTPDAPLESVRIAPTLRTPHLQEYKSDADQVAAG